MGKQVVCGGCRKHFILTPEQSGGISQPGDATGQSQAAPQIPPSPAEAPGAPSAQNAPPGSSPTAAPGQATPPPLAHVPPPPPPGTAPGTYGYSRPDQRTSGYAVASLVLGILSIVSLCLGIVLGILAIAFAGTADRQVRAGIASQGSRGMATAGRVCGIIGLILGALEMCWWFGALSAGPGWLR